MWQSSTAPAAQVAELSEKFKQIEQEASEVILAERRKRLAAKIQQLSHARRSKSAKGKFWTWAKQVLAGVEGSASLNGVGIAVQDEHGNVVCDPKLVKEVWPKHFGKLLSASGSNSKNRQFWLLKCGKPTVKLTEKNTPLYQFSASCTREVSWAELSSVLRGLPAGKAAGEDELPYEVFKMAIGREGETNPSATTEENVYCRFFLAHPITQTSHMGQSIDSDSYFSVPTERHMDC